MKYLSLFTGIGGLYKQGKTQEEIATYYGISQPQVCRLMKKWKIKARIAKNNNQRREKNPNWGGEKVGYAALHYRVESLRGKPKHCVMCQSKYKEERFEWANLTGNYKNPFEYIRVCSSCHKKIDKIVNNINL